MDTSSIIFTIAVTVLITASAVYILTTRLKTVSGDNPFPKDSNANKSMQLQAYERLVMLAERIALPNLVSRVNQSGMSPKEMQLLLLESIKQEYEYNATQQIYVSPVAWEAIKNLKDQNMLIINQVASAMEGEGTGTDLNRRLLDFVMTQKKGALHTIVLEALNYEAKKLMK